MKRPVPWRQGTRRLAVRNHRNPHRQAAAAATSPSERAFPAAIQPALIHPYWTATARRDTALKGRPITNADRHRQGGCRFGPKLRVADMEVVGPGPESPIGSPTASTAARAGRQQRRRSRTTSLDRVLAAEGAGHRVLHSHPEAEINGVQDKHDANERHPESIRLGAEVAEGDGNLHKRARDREGLGGHGRGHGQPDRPITALHGGGGGTGTGPRVRRPAPSDNPPRGEGRPDSGRGENGAAGPSGPRPDWGARPRESPVKLPPTGGRPGPPIHATADNHGPVKNPYDRDRPKKQKPLQSVGKSQGDAGLPGPQLRQPVNLKFDVPSSSRRIWSQRRPQDRGGGGLPQDAVINLGDDLGRHQDRDRNLQCADQVAQRAKYPVGEGRAHQLDPV